MADWFGHWPLNFGLGDGGCPVSGDCSMNYPGTGGDPASGGDPVTPPPADPAPTAEWILVNTPTGGSTEEGLSNPISAAIEQGGGQKASFDQIATPEMIEAIFAEAERQKNPPPAPAPVDGRPWYDRWLDNASNFFSGYGDVVTCGLMARYRKAMGWDSFVDQSSGYYTAGSVVGTVNSIALGAMNPCGAAGTAGTLLRGLNGIQAVGNALNLDENLQAGNYGWAALNALGLLGNLSQMSRACFAAGTPLLTPEGSKPIEQFRPGDLLLSAPEHDPAGAVEPREVEEVFTRHWRLFALRVAGREIRTTAEHPFYVEGKGWTPASLLASGDLLRSHDGRWLPLESVDDTGQDAVVYNMRIAEYHTYFVGSAEWGFSVWSHNAYDVKNLGELGQRAHELKALTKAKMDTVAIVRAMRPDGSFVNIVAMNSRKAVPRAILNALRSNEIPIRGTLRHAEKSGLIYAARQGWKPLEVVASRDICSRCARWIASFGATAASPLK